MTMSKYVQALDLSLNRRVSMKTEQNPDLFSPAKLGSLELQNRLVRSATAEQMATEPIGRATPALASLYGQLARGRVGLVISGE